MRLSYQINLSTSLEIKNVTNSPVYKKCHLASRKWTKNRHKNGTWAHTNNNNNLESLVKPKSEIMCAAFGGFCLNGAGRYFPTIAKININSIPKYFRPEKWAIHPKMWLIGISTRICDLNSESTRILGLIRPSTRKWVWPVLPPQFQARSRSPPEFQTKLDNPLQNGAARAVHLDFRPDQTIHPKKCLKWEHFLPIYLSAAISVKRKIETTKFITWNVFETVHNAGPACHSPWSRYSRIWRGRRKIKNKSFLH